MSDLNIKEEAGDGSVVVTDAKGRNLTIKEADFLLESRITRLCGDASTNVGYMYAYVFPTICVVAIDGDPVPFPTTFLQLEALITRVGREGTNAVLMHQNNAAKFKQHEESVKN